MKAKTYIWALTCAMMLNGCATEDLVSDTTAGARSGLTAYVDNGAPLTRMTVSDLGETSPGEEAMNENLLVTIDAFLYRPNADMTAQAVHHVFDKVSQQNSWTMTQGISEEKLKELFNVTQLTAGDYCTVYILANYGATTEGESKFTGTESRETLRQLALEADFNKKDTGGKFLAQESFVMEGTATAELTGQGIFTLTGEVPLRRVAAKVRLAVTIDPDALEKGVQDANGTLWVPEPGSMQVMLTHGVNKGIVCTDNSYAYSYPATDAPIYFPKENENEAAWEVYGRSMNVTTERGEATWYEHEVPFYSYPSLNWKDNADNETYISFMMRWTQKENPQKGQATYYQIPIAQQSTEPTLAVKNYRYYRTEMVLGVMGSFTPDDPVTLTNNSYIIVDWGLNDDHVDNAEVKPSMSEVAFLAVQANRDTLRNVTSHGIAYASSHEITSAYVTKVEYVNTRDFNHLTIENTTDTDGTLTVNTYVNGETFTVTTDNGYLTLSHAISADQYTKYDVTVKITNEAGLSEEVVFTIYPAIYVDREDGDNAFINGRFGHVYDAVHGTGKSWSSRGNGYYSWYNKSDYVYTGTSANENTSPYGSLRSDSPSLITDLTRITVTSFSQADETFRINGTDYSFQLTDPRVASDLATGTNLADYIVTAESGMGTTNNYMSNSTTAAPKSGQDDYGRDIRNWPPCS